LHRFIPEMEMDAGLPAMTPPFDWNHAYFVSLLFALAQPHG